MKELKPCPFCGCEMRVEINEYDVMYMIGKHGYNCVLDDVDVICYPEQWNTRSSAWHPWPDEKPGEEKKYAIIFQKYTILDNGERIDKGLVKPLLRHWQDGKFQSLIEGAEIKYWYEIPAPPEDE